MSKLCDLFDNLPSTQTSCSSAIDIGISSISLPSFEDVEQKYINLQVKEKDFNI